MTKQETFTKVKWIYWCNYNGTSD